MTDQQPRGPVDWARHYADQRDTAAAETQHEAETLTAAIGRVRKLGAELFVDGATRTHRAIGRQILNALQSPEDGEPTDGCTTACDGVTGIRGLLEHVGIDTTGRDITVAGRTVDAAPAHNDGPSVAEAAANDRRWWNGEKAGE
jgi:hypothetical protein